MGTETPVFQNIGEQKSIIITARTISPNFLTTGHLRSEEAIGQDSKTIE